MILFILTPLRVIKATPQNITVYYFVTEECPHCIRVDDHINSIKSEYSDVVFKRFEMSSNDTNIHLFIILTEAFNVDEYSRNPPVVFIGETCLVEEENIVSNLEKTIMEYNQGVKEYRDKAGELIGEFVESQRPSLPSVISVVFAALVDSLNPCAFATMILLLTYSLSAGSSRRMLITCIAFIIGVLLSYLAAGVGLLYIISIAAFKIPLRFIIGLAAIVFSILEFKEFFFYGRGLSLEQPSLLSRIIGQYSASMTVGTGFLIGMAVSMIELPCTGGIYLTILYLLSKIGLTLEVLLLLLLYNLIFVFPLIVILLLVYFGRSIMEVDAWRIEKRRYMRLVAGILLLVVGIAIIMGLI